MDSAASDGSVDGSDAATDGGDVTDALPDHVDAAPADAASDAAPTDAGAEGGRPVECTDLAVCCERLSGPTQIVCNAVANTNVGISCKINQGNYCE